MAELGGMIASAILKVVGDQIGSAISGQITLQQNFDEDLEKIKMALESVAAVLKVAERRSITDEPTRLWLKRLKDAMYAISDMIDEFEADTQAITQPSARKFSLKKHLAVIIPCLQIGPKITLANRMKTTREHLEVITSQHNKFNLFEGTNANELRVTDIRETSSIMDAQIIGRTEERDTILSSLSNSMTKELMVLSIYGIGGIGKTTLAKMVYNSFQFEEYSQVSVYVSQTFDLKKIGNSIISQLLKKESLYTEMQMIHTSLSELLADKKVLIVLDDLWEGEGSQLDLLKAMLNVGQGSEVVAVVTTRDEHIAKKISSIQPYKLAPLTSEMCWTVIKQKCDFDSRDDKKQLEQIGKDIANKCGGVILAAQSLGYMLHSRTYGEWLSVRDNDIWSHYGLDDTPTSHVLASLRLSYSFMPPSLRLCFAYCAIFPKGHKIVKDDLIRQWISLGFIKATNVSSCWQLGKRYIGQLLGLSFLQDSKLPSTDRVHLIKDATSFTMHDLVHDLARSVMDDEILVPGKHASTGGSCYHYALLNDCSKPPELSKIRALRFLDCGNKRLPDDAFSSAKSLRVLDLSECSIHKLPDSIGRLKQLRYLNAPGVQDEMIPVSITRLSKLIYLNLSGSSAIKTLPASIGEIEGLVYLDLSGCSGIEHMPESLGNLNKLVHLDLSNCFKVKDVSQLLGSLTELQYLNLSNRKSIGKLPRALGRLSKLQYLNLSGSSYLKCYPDAEVLGALTELEYLNLSIIDFMFRWCEVDFRGIVEDIGNLTKLRYLNLSGSIPRVSNDQVNSSICRISTLSNLEHLDLSHNDMICIPESLCNLTKLHTLDLSRCLYLKEIPESIGKIDSLKFIYLDSCFQLSKVPQLRGNAITLPRFMVHSGDGESGSNLFMLKDTNPDKLEISRLENVKSAEEAQIIKLVEKQRLRKLKLVWSVDAERFVDDKVLLEKLVPPSTLKLLEIRGYNGVSFPAWLTDQLPTNLGCLELSNMVHLEEWNASCSSFEEEHVIEILLISNCPKLRMKPLPPRAKRLRIINSDDVLSSFGECASSSSSSPVVTSTLEVERCNVPLHQWSLLHHLPRLTELKIERCGDLAVSPGIIKRLNSLKELTLVFAGQKELPEWLGDLSSLRGLRINCDVIKELPEWLGELSSLRKLTISHCRQIKEHPEWLGELSSLRGLEIHEMKELHENMRQLTQLQSLGLFSCNGLASLPHWLGELTSLKELCISRCEGIRSLPEGIQQLANLQKLEISACPELKRWCESEENKMKLAHIKEKTIW